MVKLCAHLGYQFLEFPPLERFAQAAAAGYKAVEWPGMYACAASELRDLLQLHGLQWTQVTLPTGAAGEKGLAAVPGRHDEFEAGLREAINYAQALGATAIHPMAGIVPDWRAPEVREAYLRNLRTAAQAAHESGLEVLVEVIGDGDVPGYAMCRYEHAESVFAELSDVRLRLLLDAYHAQVLTGDAVAVARRWAGRIGHVQIADVPGRHEPGTGTIDFKKFFATLDESGYQGWVGCEYRPLTTTLEGLTHLAPYLRRE